jgi:HNH endonuclease
MISVPPPDDEYPEILSAVIATVLDEGVEAGRAALGRIAYERRAIARRPGLGRDMQGLIYRRDRFTCRYCGGRLIPTPIMELIGGLYPDLFPYHPNWKGGETHPAILSRSPVIDHVTPGSTGGDWFDRENLVTACWPCNGRKADFTLDQLGWRLLPIDKESTWDGLTMRYPDLWQIAGEPKPSYHRGWIAVLVE